MARTGPMSMYNVRRDDKQRNHDLIKDNIRPLCPVIDVSTSLAMVWSIHTHLMPSNDLDLFAVPVLEDTILLQPSPRLL